MSDLDAMRAAFAAVAFDTGYFPVALGLGTALALVAALRRRGWL